MSVLCRVSVCLIVSSLIQPCGAGSFVNWESPHVHPLDLTPDGARLLAVNTADSRLEVFDLGSGVPVWTRSIPTGLDPVSVRARTNGQAWVVNHISDTVSVVDLSTGVVLATLDTDDEPADVVFAGSPTRAFVSCSAANTVLVFDPANLTASPTRITLDGEDPRSLAVSPDGSRVYAAIFESGNGTTLVNGDTPAAGSFPPNAVSDPAGPYGGQNPAPNSGGGFDPPQNPANPSPEDSGVIVRRSAAGQWLDDNGGNWTSMVSGGNASASGRSPGWDLIDHDVAVIQTSGLGVSYLDRLMNHNMAVSVRPTDGRLAIVGTDAINEVRFEPNLSGRFLRVLVALWPGSGTPALTDMNPHLDYSTSSVSPALRARGLGDPRAVAWNAGGDTMWVAGMGSNNLVAFEASGARSGNGQPIPVGQGPTGLAMDDGRNRIYVLNRFEPSISVVDPGARVELQRIPFFDATPDPVQRGRAILFDTQATSGTGYVSCASCHTDARYDRLAWDLGDPGGTMLSGADQNIGMGQGGLNDGTDEWHPMKGPMLTQTLRDIIGKEPLHWRGDRDGLGDFSGAFVSLLGDDSEPTAAQMQDFSDYLATLVFPPNPFRNFDNSLPDDLPLDGMFRTGRFGGAGQPMPNGDATRGLDLYRPPSLLLNGNFACSTCHTLPTGMGPDSELNGGSFDPLPPGPNGERHHGLIAVVDRLIKIPQLRNLYDRTGGDWTGQRSLAGFGYGHDGRNDSLVRFVSSVGFEPNSEQDVADVTAFLLAFAGSDLPVGSNNDDLEPLGPTSKDSHATVGAQVTASSPGTPGTKLSAMLNLANSGDLSLIAHARRGGETRGFAYLGGGTFQSDRSAETLTTQQLLDGATTTDAVTFTAVPVGSELRLGIDRDEDGAFDRDETDAGSNPMDADDVPACCAEGPLLFEATFNGSTDGFGYEDDPFRGTSAPSYASGSRDPGAGDNGALVVDLGGIDGADIPGMSGGWGRQLPVPTGTPLMLSFRYSMTMLPDYESSEWSQVLVSFDGNLVGVPPNDHVDQLVGNGNGGPAMTTGWQTVTLDLGPAATGSERLVIGVYNNLKTFTNESTELLIDDVRILGSDPCAADGDGDGISDCDDTCFDVDLDGFGDGVGCLDADCDDDDGAVHPQADESCNGIDDDCDGAIDESDAVDTTTWFADSDSDGFGNADVTEDACSAPPGFVGNDQDCDDSNGDVHPGALDVCNGADDDCDGAVDEDGVPVAWFADTDGDGFGDPATTQDSCSAPVGFVANDQDCNDANPAIHPGVQDGCDGTDDDCDGSVDEDGVVPWFADSDGDGFGDPAVSSSACSAPAGFVGDDRDCDDADASVHPGVSDDCNAVDDDCDGAIDEDGATDTWFADTDGDGFGDPNGTVDACFAPAGFVGNAQDCNDDDSSVHPGAADVCNGTDDDCDGATDEDAAASTWYRDNDGDGFGDPVTTAEACAAPPGFVSDAQDCNDANAAVHPGVSDGCNGVDDDCDAAVDEDFVGQPVSCGVGSCAANGLTVCEAGTVVEECAPGDPLPEVCDDGADNDCNGFVDCQDGGCSTDEVCNTGFELTADFEAGTGGLVFVTDPFRGTSEPVYSSGAWDPAIGFGGGGALRVELGGLDNVAVFGMSGGWRLDFDLDTSSEVFVTFRYRLTQDPEYESDESSQVLVSIDGALRGIPGADFVDEISGNGNGGPAESTGWQQITLNLGVLGAGGHELILGGYNSKKTWNNESTEVLIDDLLVTSEARTITTLLDETFAGGAGGFTLELDLFRGTSEPVYATGAYAPGAGQSGDGALRVELGGLDNVNVLGMSAGWRTTLTVGESTAATLIVTYRLTQTPEYESDESSQMLAALDGVLVGPGGNDFLDQIAGNGGGGGDESTGWVTVELDLGVLSPGTHVLDLGGYNNKKTWNNETTEVLLDDVRVVVVE